MFTLGDAIVRILGDDSQLGKTLQGAKVKMGEFVKSAGAALAGAVTGGIAIAAGAAATAVLGIGGAVVNTSRQFAEGQNRLQGALALTEEQANGVGDVMQDVWANNFGDDIADVEQGVLDVALAMKRVGETSNEQLTASTEDAFRLRDAYGIDVAESIGTATTLVDTMGLSYDEAFDFITSGIQNGLNANDDFLDSIGEYSGLFAETGFSAEQMYALMETGAQGGVLGTDKMSDAIKEMGIILNEGGKEVASTFDDIGLNFGEIEKSVRSGEASWADYFPQIIDGINNIEDPIARQQAQVALFGTMAEDLGVSFTEGLSTATVALEDMAGATDEIDARYQTLGDLFEGTKRKILDSLVPVGDKILDIANDNMPAIQDGIDAFAGAVEDMVPHIVDFISRMAEVIANGPTLTERIENVKAAFDKLKNLVDVVVWITDLISPIDEVIEISGRLKTAWDEDWGGIRTTTIELTDKVKETVSSFISDVEQWWSDHGDAILATIQGWKDQANEIFDSAFEGIKGLIDTFKLAGEGKWEEFGEALVNQSIVLVADVVEEIGKLWELIKPHLETALQNAKAKFTEIDWGEVGGSIVAGVIQGVNNAADALYDTLRGMARAAFNAAKAALGIESPSKLFAEQVGAPIPQGMAQGIEREAGLVERAVQRMAEAAARAAGGAGGRAGGNTTNNSFGGSTFILNGVRNGANVAGFVARSAQQAQLQSTLGF